MTILIAWLLTLSTFALEPHQCGNFFLSIEQRVMELDLTHEVFGYKAKVARVDKHNNRSYNQITLFDQNEQLIGEISYIIRDKRLDVEGLFIGDYRSQGLGTAFYQHLLENNPQLETISGFLAATNKKIFNEAFKTMQFIDAVKQTPAYKIRNKLGFGIVDENDSIFIPNENANKVLIKLVTKKSP